MAGPSSGGRHPLVFMARLYGGPLEVFRLAEFDAPIPGLTQPVIVHVDYVQNQIHRLSLEDHAAYLVNELSKNRGRGAP